MPYANQDLESAHVTYQLARIFENAHWKVVRQAQSPIKLQGRIQHRIPIGIWILTSRDRNYGYFLWALSRKRGSTPMSAPNRIFRPTSPAPSSGLVTRKRLSTRGVTTSDEFRRQSKRCISPDLPAFRHGFQNHVHLTLIYFAKYLLPVSQSGHEEEPIARIWGPNWGPTCPF